MNTTVFIMFFIGIFIVAIFGKILLFPLRKILKLVLNSILGGILIFIVNLIGSFFNFHIGINIVTAVFARNTRGAGCDFVSDIKAYIRLEDIKQMKIHQNIKKWHNSVEKSPNIM